MLSCLAGSSHPVNHRIVSHSLKARRFLQLYFEGLGDFLIALWPMYGLQLKFLSIKILRDLETVILSKGISF